jgi:hypothetical protein
MQRQQREMWITLKLIKRSQHVFMHANVKERGGKVEFFSGTALCLLVGGTELLIMLQFES